MAKLECQYFPGTPATWACTACDAHFGEKCIPAAHSVHWRKQQPRCIRCEGTLCVDETPTRALP